MTFGSSDKPAGVFGRTLADIAFSPRVANEETGWAYYPGNERDANGRVVSATFYINDDRLVSDNLDGSNRVPSEW